MNVIEVLESRTLLTVTIDPVAAQTFPAGKSIFVPVTGTTDSTTRVNYSVASNNGTVSAQQVSNLTFVRLNISIGGTPRGYLEFALFGDIAPKTVARITNLVNSGFYNNLTFHRVIPGFMAQGGDPQGTGSGGTGTTFDDEFNRDAIFTTTGQLAMANSGADTNDSQFFVTVDDTRWLDFRHTIFGQLVRGKEVLDQIMAVPTAGEPQKAGDPPKDTPLVAVVITSASIVQNKVDTVLLVKGSGPATITVTAQDQNSTSNKTFNATTVADTTDDPPFLNALADQQTVSDLPVSFNVGTTDIDAGTPHIEAISYDTAKLAVTYSGNVVTVTPVNGFSGSSKILVGVQRPSDGSWDKQELNVTVLPGPFATYDAATRKLTVNGTSGDDNLQFTRTATALDVTMNGKKYSFGLSAISTVNVTLGAGNDVMGVQAGSTIGYAVVAGDGNDSIWGGDGNDTLFGEEGDDTLLGAMGNDYLDCGPGNDLAGGHYGWDTILGAAGRDTLKGGDNGDLIRGGGGMDSLLGGKGMDTIYGSGGNDTIDGQDGADSLYGGDHDDVITGGTKLDHIFGDAGNDTIYSNDGEMDTVEGGDGNDTATRDSLDVLLGIEGGRIQL